MSIIPQFGLPQWLSGKGWTQLKWLTMQAGTYLTFKNTWNDLTERCWGAGNCCYLVANWCLTLQPHGLVAHQAPLSMGFPRQKYQSGLPFPSLGDLPDPGIKPGSPAFQTILYHWATREALMGKNTQALSDTREICKIEAKVLYISTARSWYSCFHLACGLTSLTSSVIKYLSKWIGDHGSQISPCKSVRFRSARGGSQVVHAVREQSWRHSCAFMFSLQLVQITS